jgi:hypothetical protein
MTCHNSKYVGGNQAVNWTRKIRTVSQIHHSVAASCEVYVLTGLLKTLLALFIQRYWVADNTKQVA